MDRPLVTVICLCYNHAPYLREAVLSVVGQTYPNIETIIVDDASTDNSRAVIAELLRDHHHIKYLPLRHNMGNCSAFNEGLALAKGEYLVDLATDDVMHPERIAKQVAKLQSLGAQYGVVYSNADYIDEQGRWIRNHAEHLQKHGLVKNMPQGDVFAQLISRYFICSPTMMVRRSVMLALGGYDSKLAYEDFDFWVRSSRYTRYAYLDETLTKVRKVSGSMSSRWYQQGDKQLYSTYLVCLKALGLVQNAQELQALVIRVRYELRQAVFAQLKQEATLFYRLLIQINGATPPYKLLHALDRLELPLASLRRWYNLMRFG